MNPRDLPEVVAELIIEMHEVRSEISALNGRIDRLERVVATGFHELREEMRGTHEEQRGMREEQRGVREEQRGMREEQRGMREEQRGMREEQRGMREDIQAMPDRIGAAVFKSLEPFLNRLLEHDDQLRNQDSRLKTLENL